MHRLDEIASYATSFSAEITKQFRADVMSAARGLAKEHAVDADHVDALLWAAIVENLGPDEEDIDLDDPEEDYFA